MKVHNYGNDYAYQQAQKGTKETAVNEPIVEEPVTEEAQDVVDTVQDGRESPVASPETASEGTDEKKPTVASKKKKRQG